MALSDLVNMLAVAAGVTVLIAGAGVCATPTTRSIDFECLSNAGKDFMATLVHMNRFIDIEGSPSVGFGGRMAASDRR